MIGAVLARIIYDMVMHVYPSESDQRISFMPNIDTESDYFLYDVVRYAGFKNIPNVSDISSFNYTELIV